MEIWIVRTGNGNVTGVERKTLRTPALGAAVRTAETLSFTGCFVW